MVEEVRTRVANWLRGGPGLPVHTDKDTASEDELEPATKRKRVLKSGKIMTVDTLVTRKITWPHEIGREPFEVLNIGACPALNDGTSPRQRDALGETSTVMALSRVKCHTENTQAK